MAKFDNRGNALASTGQFKVTLANGTGGALKYQIVPPSATSTDGTAIQTGPNAGAVPVRICRILTGTGTGAIVVYDGNDPTSLPANAIWTGAAASGGSVVLDCPTSTGLIVSVGANTTVTVVCA